MSNPTSEMAQHLKNGKYLCLYLNGLSFDGFIFVIADLEHQVGKSLETREMIDHKGQFVWVWLQGLPTPPQIRFLEGAGRVCA